MKPLDIITHIFMSVLFAYRPVRSLHDFKVKFITLCTSTNTNIIPNRPKSKNKNKNDRRFEGMKYEKGQLCYKARC